MPRAPITARPQSIYIRPAPGWLEVCEREVASILKKPFQKYKFEPKLQRLKSTLKVSHCDWRQALECVFRLRSAHDVEWLFVESPCRSWQELERVLQKSPWDEILPQKDVSAHVTIDIIRGFTSGSAKLRSKFCEYAKIEHVSEGTPIRFKLELRDQRVRILVSLAGEPLYKRDYKEVLQAVAPLPEHLAASCIQWVLEQTEEPVGAVWAPFAGSGTFGFESLLVLGAAGPGTFRKSFACEAFPATPLTTIQYLRRKMRENWEKNPVPKIVFNEMNEDVMLILQANTKNFSSQAAFEFQKGNFWDFKMPLPETGSVMLLLNPPFGDRLAKKSSIIEIYKKIGDRLRRESEKVSVEVLGGCLCPDEKTWRSLLSALQPENFATHHFTHGGKEMRILRWKKKGANFR